jgi:hypothetical protein
VTGDPPTHEASADRRVTGDESMIGDQSHLGLVKADSAPWGFRGRNKFFDCGKDLRELLVVLLLKRFDFARKVAVGVHQTAKLYEGAHGLRC